MRKRVCFLGVVLVVIGILGLSTVRVRAGWVGESGTEPIIAEASVEPERWSELQFVGGGEVAEVRVRTGTPVAEGDVLLRLDATEAALAVQEAEAALITANAELALKRAGPRIEEVAAAEAELQAAQGDLRRAVALRDQFVAGTAEAEFAAVQARLEAAKAERQQAELAIVRAKGSGDEERKTQAQEQLQAANLKVAAAEARLAAQPQAAAARLRAAKAGVWAAQAQVDITQAQLDLIKAGPTAQEIALAEADVQHAEATLAAARVALERTALLAPFDGTVTRIHAEAGDTVAPGQAVLVLAKLERLHVKTTDLTELDVVHVREGQPVVVTVDALPEEMFDGTVREVALQAGDYHGDVVYAVSVDLGDANAADPRLRWGMTAVVKIAE
jgi:multidrug resistance efflux pump